MGALAVFGITDDTLNLVVNLLLLCLVVLYFALIYWTYADAKRRVEDPMLVGCATAAAFFPFIGAVVYMIVRPPEYIEIDGSRNPELGPQWSTWGFAFRVITGGSRRIRPESASTGPAVLKCRCG